MSYMSIGAYAIDPSLAQNRTLIVGASVVAIWLGMGINILGVRVGRWNQNVGAIATWAMVVLLLGTGILAYWRQGSATALHLAPPLEWGKLNFWSQIAFALCGLELLGMMGAEIRDPERTIARAGWIAGLLAVVFYSSATLAMVVLRKPEEISILYGIVQVAGGGWLAVMFAVLSMLTVLGQFGGLGVG